MPAPEPLPIDVAAKPSVYANLTSGSNAVALVGVVALAAVMGMVAGTGIVATVAISKERT